MWQDTVIAICQLLFIVAMWPTIKGKDKPALSTCIMNTVLVAVIAFCLGTLHLWFSLITATSTALLWLTLVIQKMKIDKAKTARRVTNF